MKRADLIVFVAELAGPLGPPVSAYTDEQLMEQWGEKATVTDIEKLFDLLVQPPTTWERWRLLT